MRDLRLLPKADLHVHLEGSIRPATLRELALANGCPLPPALAEDGWRFDGFLDFLANYGHATSCLRRPGDFRRIAYELCEDEAAQGVAWMEVTFSLRGHARRASDWDMPIVSVLEGLADGERDFGVSSRVVVDPVRDSTEYAGLCLDSALRHRDAGVVAFGLGGWEGYPIEPFAEFFRRAVDGGLRSVPHAGESEGPDSIRAALELLAAERLGHGIRVLEDDDLVAEVRERRVPLEVCPTSNVVTGLVPSVADHPLPRLVDAGLVVTLNSDDPAMFASPLLGEYEVARATFGLDDEALAALARNGVDASFAPETAKAALLAAIDAWLAADAAD